MLGRLHIHNVQRTQPTSGHLARPRSDYLSTIEVSPPRSPGLYTCGDARVDVAKVAKAAAKVAKVARPPTGASHPMVGVAPTQTILPGSRPHESAAVGGLPRFAPDQPKNAGAQQGRVEAASAPAPTARDMCGLETCAGPRQMRAPGMCGTGETCAGMRRQARWRTGGLTAVQKSANKPT